MASIIDRNGTFNPQLNVTKPQIELIAFILGYKNKILVYSLQVNGQENLGMQIYQKHKNFSKFKIQNSLYYSENSLCRSKSNQQPEFWPSVCMTAFKNSHFQVGNWFEMGHFLATLSDFMSKMDVFTCLKENHKICVHILRFLRVEVDHKLIQTSHKNMERVD